MQPLMKQAILGHEAQVMLTGIEWIHKVWFIKRLSCWDLCSTSARIMYLANLFH